MSEKDIRFADKKVDSSWKASAASEKSKPAENAAAPVPTSKPFVNLLSSLGYQAMMHLGDLPDPETKVPAVNLDAAREIIDLLVALKKKTENNLSPEETRLMTQLVAELQLKFSQKV
ncbi:MAG: DUF1844 domain-containing protein [Candidatus Omnitrophota bacterium]|jgi:hypothetical protein